MLQFDLQFYEELTVAGVKTVKFISGVFFGRQVSLLKVYLDTSLKHLHLKSTRKLKEYWVPVCT